MAPINGPAPRPCDSCPYRTDHPSGVWDEEEYHKLAQYDRDLIEQPQGIFQCHQNERGSDKARICAGWVATHGGSNLLALRIAAAAGRIEDAVIKRVFGYRTPIKTFTCGEEARDNGLRDIHFPGLEARLMMDKIRRTRPDIAGGEQ